MQANQMPGAVPDGRDAPDKFYYGRGYLQLSWSSNYHAASQALFGDDRLVQNPDQVASNEDIAWATAFWFWKANVRSAPGVQNGNFAMTILKINSMECKQGNAQAKNRFRFYGCAYKAFGVSGNPPSYTNC